MDEIDPIGSPTIHPQLVQTTANRLDVIRVASFQGLNE